MGMIQFDSGKKHESGLPIMADIDENIAKALNEAKKRNKRDWGFACLNCGISGSGKSTGTRTHALYACPWFDTSYIAFTADEFIDITTRCPQYSAVVLDEGFADLNSNVSRSKDFQKILNHLQIIRQKNLFIFICLPNFFDLNKGIALFQSNILLVYFENEKGYRGSIAVFDRFKKQALYLKGKKDLNYLAVKPNYYSRFYKNKDCLDNEAYEKKKTKHFKSQNEKLEKFTPKSERNDLMFKLKNEEGYKNKRLAELTGITVRQIERIMATYLK